MSTLALKIRSPVTWATRSGFDCVSWFRISMGWFLPSPHTTPSLVAAWTTETIHLSGPPNEARAPVSGDRAPILMERPASTAAETVVVLAATVVVVAPRCGSGRAAGRRRGFLRPTAGRQEAAQPGSYGHGGPRDARDLKEFAPTYGPAVFV